MDSINWDLLKFKFEVLGISKEQLQDEYDVPPSVMEYASRSWTPIKAAHQKVLNIDDLSSLEAITDQIVAQVQEESIISALLKQRFMNPKLACLEATILSKITELANNVNIESISAPTTLKTITGIYKEILDNNSLSKINFDGEAKDGTPDELPQWEIRIVKPDQNKYPKPAFEQSGDDKAEPKHPGKARTVLN